MRLLRVEEAAERLGLTESRPLAGALVSLGSSQRGTSGRCRGRGGAEAKSGTGPGGSKARRFGGWG